MLWEMFGTGQWLGAVAVISLGAGRLIKAAWSTIPALLLHFLVVLVSYGVILGDQLLDTNFPWQHDIYVALFGLLTAPAAIGLHEFMKKGATAAATKVGANPEDAERMSERILGKLKEKAIPPPSEEKVKEGSTS